MPRPSSLFRLAVLVGTACLVRAIVREARSDRGLALLPAPEAPQSRRSRSAGNHKPVGRRDRGA